MKNVLNLLDKNGKVVSFEIKSEWSFFTFHKIKKLLKEGYSFATEDDAKLAIKYKLYI